MDYGEERSILVGMMKGRLIVVVYADCEDRIRIVSARKANKKKTDDYYKNQKTA
jgi:uncharacterized DUF497 family protein